MKKAVSFLLYRLTHWWTPTLVNQSNTILITIQIQVTHCAWHMIHIQETLIPFSLLTWSNMYMSSNNSDMLTNLSIKKKINYIGKGGGTLWTSQGVIAISLTMPRQTCLQILMEGTDITRSWTFICLSSWHSNTMSVFKILHRSEMLEWNRYPQLEAPSRNAGHPIQGEGNPRNSMNKWRT